MPKKGNAPPTVPTCHPERKHVARGLCKACYDADYAARNRDRINAKSREWSARNPERRLATRRKYLYGVTSEEVETRIEAQGGVCAICKTGPPEHLDHDHETNLARGLLCGNCNRGLGLFSEDAERLLSAIVYLQEWDDRCVQVETNTGRRMDGLE